LQVLTSHAEVEGVGALTSRIWKNGLVALHVWLLLSGCEMCGPGNGQVPRLFRKLTASADYEILEEVLCNLERRRI